MEITIKLNKTWLQIVYCFKVWTMICTIKSKKISIFFLRKEKKITLNVISFMDDPSVWKMSFSLSLPGETRITLGHPSIHLLNQDLFKLETVDGVLTLCSHHDPVPMLPPELITLQPHLRLLLLHPILLVSNDGPCKLKQFVNIFTSSSII